MTLDRTLQVILFLLLVANIAFWFSVRGVQARWNNVPPAPDKQYAALYGLGDESFSYRLNGLMIQNLGDTGGRVTPLDEYDYEALTRWFFVQDHLDPYSDYTPYLAAYYFGGVQKPSKLMPMIGYLENVGLRPFKEKWRWLTQAIFLARFRMKDMDRALEMAHKLAAIDYTDMPGWAKQMPVFIMNVQGEKKAAYAIMLEILRTSKETLHPSEVLSMRVYMCTRLLSSEEAEQNPLCEGI